MTPRELTAFREVVRCLKFAAPKDHLANHGNDPYPFERCEFAECMESRAAVREAEYLLGPYPELRASGVPQG